MVIDVVMAIIAYLIGSINFSVIISKKVAGFDVREKGSGNAGSTNMLRSVGKGAAVLTLLCDILKGVVAILIAIGIGNLVKDADKGLLVQIAFNGPYTNGIIGIMCSSSIVSSINIIYKRTLYCSRRRKLFYI